MSTDEKHLHEVEKTIIGFWKTVPPLWHYTRAAIHHNASEGFGITSAQYHVMRRIKEGGRRTVSELSECMFVSRPNISRAVEEMAKAGYIARERDTKDRRIVYLSITSEGSALMEDIYAKNHMFLHDVFAPLSDEELQVVQNAFNLLEKTLNSDNINP